MAFLSCARKKKGFQGKKRATSLVRAAQEASPSREPSNRPWSGASIAGNVQEGQSGEKPGPVQ